jgi:hypothetical protein
MAILAKSTGQSSPKTVELIIYISSKFKDKPNYGSTLLGKSLCLIDSMNYLKTSHPISELYYIKQEFGPTPEPKKFLTLGDNLVRSGDLEKIDSSYFGRTQNKFIAKRPPRTEVFDQDEMLLIDDVLESICDQNATEISTHTHSFLAWILVKNNEELPFYTFLLTQTDPDVKDLVWANKSIKTYKASTKQGS